MSENRIAGKPLSAGHLTTLSCAIEEFAARLRSTGLGDDEHGKAMTRGYLVRIAELARLIQEARMEKHRQEAAREDEANRDALHKE